MECKQGCHKLSHFSTCYDIIDEKTDMDNYITISPPVQWDEDISTQSILKKAKETESCIIKHQLEITKLELTAVRNDLGYKCAIIDNLKNILKFKEKKIASVELQRDLVEAEKNFALGVKREMPIKYIITERSFQQYSYIPGGEELKNIGDEMSSLIENSGCDQGATCFTFFKKGVKGFDSKNVSRHHLNVMSTKRLLLVTLKPQWIRNVLKKKEYSAIISQGVESGSKEPST